MYLFYNFLLTILSPIWVPWLLWRTRKRKETPIWSERQGNYTGIPKKVRGEYRVWVHAVSVGEVVAAMPFLKELKAQRPDLKIVLSVTTSSGHQTARERAADLYDYLVYFPIDIAKFQIRAVAQVRPDAIAIMETELWFNFLWSADVFDTPTFVVNGRISNRSWGRSQKLKWFYRALLKYVQAALVQSETDADRFRELGAKEVLVLGNTKFDEASALPRSDAETWRKELQLDDRPVVVVGSTRSEMEERMVVGALASLGDSIQIVHAPRHLETAERLQGIAREKFASVGLRSAKSKADYLILDTYGELGAVYSVADVVIIGGGFDKLGGQNLIQPLAMGKPVVHGPHMFNFLDVSTMSLNSGASIAVTDEAALANALRDLLNDPERRASMSDAAKGLVLANIGASKRYAEVVLDSMSEITQPRIKPDAGPDNK